MGKRKKSPGSRKQVTTAFIACSKRKKVSSVPLRARFLYQGALFKKALQYAEKEYDQVFILSAKHGIVHPDEFLRRYDKTLNNMGTTERNEWYEMIREQIIKRDLNPPFIFLTGSLYNAPFEGTKPLEGLSIGKQLKWFNERLKPKTLFDD